MTSTLTRHRPAVITALVITIGCSLWYAYSASHSKPPPSLHRSNAVHRRHNPLRNAQGPEDPARDGDGSSAAGDQVESASPDQHDAGETVAGSEPFSRTPQRRDGTGLKELLYYIAEEQSRLNGYMHRGVMCNGCFMKPIRGVRWRCANCADYDLCSDCESTGMHSKTHIFYKVKIPAPFLGNPQQSQPVAYPGKPEEMLRELPAEASKIIAAKTHFDKEETDALYDQFTCLANTSWPADPLEIGQAIDRRAFDTAFIPLTSICAPAPNLLYDRIFAYYDSDRNGLIGFEELMIGLSYVQQKGRDPSRRRRMIFNGFDLDRDNYICRRDVLRLFRAYYAIQKDITHDLVAAQEEELDMANVADHISGSQPLSAVFTEPARLPLGRESRLSGKTADQFGERRHGDNALYESSNDTCAPKDVLSAKYDRTTVSNGSMEQSTDSADAFVSDLHQRMKRDALYSDFEEDANLANTGSWSERTPLGHIRTASTWHEDVNGAGFVERAGEQSQQSRLLRYSKGKYNISVVQPDTTIGSEILYQVMLEGLNELLDPLFKAREELAMEVEASIKEREHWSDLIHEFSKTVRAPNKKGQVDGATEDKKKDPSRAQSKDQDAEEDDNDEQDDASSQSSSSSDASSDWSTVKSLTNSRLESSRSSIADKPLPDVSSPRKHTVQDPTMPQFRPNSLEDMVPMPSSPRLRRLVTLNRAARDIAHAGGPGRLSLREFERLMDGETGRKLAFVDSWFELGSF